MSDKVDSAIELGARVEQQSLLYDERFLESYAGSIMNDPSTAIMELVANCWDAYATEVNVAWPDAATQRPFRVSDNGKGMTRSEFQNIWRTIAYNRIAAGGPTSKPPDDIQGQPRLVFGKNGKGRFASFCFAQEYTIRSRRDGEEFIYRVFRTPNNPLVLEEVSFSPTGATGHGTEIIGSGEIPRLLFPEEKAREVIGSRFLANPAFKVSLGGKEISFSDIPDLLSTQGVDVPGYGVARLLHIDSKKAHKTTKQHGIAWWVQNRAVGECKWSRSDYERVLDGRTTEAKRFTFIAQADFLNGHNAVEEDWSGFKDSNAAWLKTREAVQDRIGQVILDGSKAEREARRSAVIERIGNAVNTLSPVGKDRITSFVNEVVDSCPNFGENEIVQLSGVLTKLEKAKSRYGLLDLLHQCEPQDYDTLHTILQEWTIGMAKIVLDEIQTRLRLISELRAKLKVVGVDEVHELQPLFERGLWMFGAQFETIDFTSNQGMTQVIRTVFKHLSGKGTRNRPDFVALPDSSVGFYARPAYNDQHDEDGVAHLVIIDLKTTGLALGGKEKNQVWKYVKELREKGYLRLGTKVDGFVLGDKMEPGENEPTKQGEGVTITPMLYETILIRAEKRLLNLHKKVKEAPFLENQKDELEAFMKPLAVRQAELSPI